MSWRLNILSNAPDKPKLKEGTKIGEVKMSLMQCNGWNCILWGLENDTKLRPFVTKYQLNCYITLNYNIILNCYRILNCYILLNSNICTLNLIVTLHSTVTLYSTVALYSILTLYWSCYIQKWLFVMLSHELGRTLDELWNQWLLGFELWYQKSFE